MIKVNLVTDEGLPPNSLYVIDKNGIFQGVIKNLQVIEKPKSNNVHMLQDELNLENWLDGKEIVTEMLHRVGERAWCPTPDRDRVFARTGGQEMTESHWAHIWQSMLDEGIPYCEVEREANMTMSEMWGGDPQFEFLFVRLWRI